MRALAFHPPLILPGHPDELTHDVRLANDVVSEVSPARHQGEGESRGCVWWWSFRHRSAQYTIDASGLHKQIDVVDSTIVAEIFDELMGLYSPR